MIDVYIRVVVLIIFDHIIFALKFLLSFIIPDVPLWVQEGRAKRNWAEKEKTKGLLLKQLIQMKVYDENKPLAARVESAKALFSEDSETKAEKQYAISKLSGKLGSGHFYNPATLSWLLCVPPVLQQLGYSPLYYVPCAFLMLSYLSSEKAKWNKHQALGIVTDAAVSVYDVSCRSLVRSFY